MCKTDVGAVNLSVALPENKRQHVVKIVGKWDHSRTHDNSFRILYTERYPL